MNFTKQGVESQAQKSSKNRDDTDTNQSNQSVLQTYIDGFTIHGLSKIFGGVLYEKIFWFTVLAACLGFFISQGYFFFIEYKKYDVRTEVRIKSDTNINLPAVTICRSLNIRNYEFSGFVNENRCYKNRSVYDNSKKSCRIPQNRINIDLKSGKNIQSHPDFPSCVTINPFGNVSTASDAIQDTYRIIWRESKGMFGYSYLYLYTHDPDDIPFSSGQLFAGTTLIKDRGTYDVMIHDKRVNYRLKHPFPSNCTDGENRNIFPGPYTVKKCQDTCLFNKMLRECGTVVDHWRKYIHKNISINETWEFTASCLKHVARKRINNSFCQCPLSCSETTFDTDLKQMQYIAYTNVAEFRLVYEKNTFTMVTEIDAYPFEKFLTDIGSWCGLFTGMSVLSIVEILIFLLLAMVALCKKLRKVFWK